MNFLAHVYLSGTEEGIIIGNFIADGIKGIFMCEESLGFFHYTT